MSSFKSAMAKLAIVGQNRAKLVDCSEAVPNPIPPVKKATTFPAGTSHKDLQQACIFPFPSLAVDGELIRKTLKNSLSLFVCDLAGAPTQIPGCPDGSLDADNCPS